jgi:hypothetical protein
MVHGTGEDTLSFLLLALAMVAVSTASASATMTAVPALSLLAAMSSRTPAGCTTAPAASPAFTSPGTSGGVIRSYVHVILVFVITRVRVKFIQKLGFAQPIGSSSRAHARWVESRAAAGFS